jgi:uncharacterized protein Yka (UPF0111/DUF47 family)
MEFTTPADFQRLLFARQISAPEARWSSSFNRIHPWLKIDGLFVCFLEPEHTMFSLQALFGKGDRFYQLLEDAAREAHESVRLVVALIKSPASTKGLDDLALTRRKEKKISEQITAELVKTFVTGLEREDIEALSLSLYKIPKTVEKLAEHINIGHQHLEGMDFARQVEIMEQATDVVLTMVIQLRDMKHLEKIHEMNIKLQYLEGEADKLMMDLLKDLYSGHYDALKVMVIRDLYELMEKVIDRCRDAGNVVMHIVLKNS